MKKQKNFGSLFQNVAGLFTLLLFVSAWQVSAQSNNMTGQYTGSGNVPITLYNCTDPKDNGNILVTSRVLSITETNPGTITGSLNLTVLLEVGSASATFSVNGTAPLGNPRTLSAAMLSQTPPLTLLNGNFSGSWSQSGNTMNITINLSGTGSTGKGQCSYTGSLPMSGVSIPQCTSPEPERNFGDVPLGTTVEQLFNFTNSTGVSFTPTDFTLEGDADYYIRNNTCQGTLLFPGQSCSWLARFTARAGGLRKSREHNILSAPSGNGSQCNKLTAKGTLNPEFIDPYYQANSPWSLIPYGHCTLTNQGYNIGAKGCNLTALTMAINYLKKAAPVFPSLLPDTPGVFHAYALRVNGFSARSVNQECVSGISGNDIQYDNIVANYSIPFSPVPTIPFSPDTKPFKWNHIDAIRSINNPNAAASLSEYLKNGYPMIVAILHKNNSVACNVNDPADTCYYRGHFVLVTGDSGGGSLSRFRVVDPGKTANINLQKVLDSRNGSSGWQTVGYVSVIDDAYKLPKQPRNYTGTNLTDEEESNLIFAPAADSVDRGSISIGSDEKIDFIITNPQGQKTGYNSVTQRIVREIPDSSYALENIFLAEEPVPTTATRSASIGQPINGSYQVLVKGNTQGEYRVSINRSNRYGQSLTPIIFTGSIQTGETKTRSFIYTSSKNTVDFDKDGNADISVFRPSNGAWYLQQSQNGFTGVSFGISTDRIVPADYDGDGKTDVAVFRNGVWYLQRSQLGFAGAAFGASNDIPVPADYDGDGKADLAVFRPSNGTWYLQRSQLGFTGIQFGVTSDKPVVADYDGDGKTDVAVFRAGVWYIQRSQSGFIGIAFGLADDKPVPADYDGDGKADVAVFRPSNGAWYLQRSQLGFTGLQFGVATDAPAPADYDGDGKTDVAVFRSGTWYLNRSTAGFTGVAFGAASDRAVPNAFVP